MITTNCHAMQCHIVQTTKSANVLSQTGRFSSKCNANHSSSWRQHTLENNRRQRRSVRIALATLLCGPRSGSMVWSWRRLDSCVARTSPIPTDVVWYRSWSASIPSIQKAGRTFSDRREWNRKSPRRTTLLHSVYLDTHCCVYRDTHNSGSHADMSGVQYVHYDAICGRTFSQPVVADVNLSLTITSSFFQIWPHLIRLKMLLLPYYLTTA